MFMGGWVVVFLLPGNCYFSAQLTYTNALTNLLGTGPRFRTPRLGFLGINSAKGGRNEVLKQRR
jgi:hypothetical protein